MENRTESKEPLFEHVVCSGVGIIEHRHGKRTLVISRSREEAVGLGVSREKAEMLFEGFEMAGGCHENWGTFGGSLPCDITGCTSKCHVQVNRLDGNGWGDVTDGGSAPVDSNWAYRCNCH